MAIIKQLLNTFHKRERVADLLCILEGYDGYKRESAARRLGLLGDPTAIPKLIVRVNDWVPQVRDTAREALLRLLVPENAFVFAENLPQIYHLEHCGRDNHEEIIQRVIDFLVLPENKQVLQNAVLSEKPKVARAAVNLLLQHFSEDMEKTVLNCLQHPDVMVRSIAADQFRHFSQNNLPSVLEIAINDPFMPVRREAFQIYLKDYPDKGIEIGKHFLFDRHVAIRELAIVSLQASGSDVKSLYANTLSDQSRRIVEKKCSILGLAFLQAHDEMPSIVAHLDSEMPSIRKAALQAIEKLKGDEYKTVYINHLSDRSSSVAKEASRIIVKLKIPLNSSEVLAIDSAHSTLQTLQIVTHAMKKSNKWEKLVFLLSALNRVRPKSDELHECLLSEISKWDRNFNRSSSQPTTEQIAAIKCEYRGCEPVLNANEQRSIEFTLRALKII